MDKTKTKKWLISFFSGVVVFTLILSLITYIVDPYMQFRVRDNEYLLNETYVNPGLIKNYDYDAMMIGSSMTMNFDIDLMAEKLNVKPLKTAVNSMSVKEMKTILSLAYEKNKSKEYYICIDLNSFTREGEYRSPEYLYEDGVIPTLRYVFNYESWLRYIPIDVALKAIKGIGVAYPGFLAKKTSIDTISYWGDEYKYGEDVVIEKFLNNKARVADIQLENLEERMKSIIDDFFETVDVQNGKHVFFFPPYSSLFWYNTQKDGYFEQFTKAKEYFYLKSREAGCEVYDFQAEEFTMDLDNYRDTTHYKPEINDWMVECFASKEHLINEDNSKKIIEQLRGNTSLFVSEHSQLCQPLD